MIKKLLLAVLGLVIIGIAVFCIVVAMQPAQFKVTRSAAINATPDVVFAQVNDFQKWGAWSPWDKRDPNMKRTISTPSYGNGAFYQWSGNDDVGEGKMTIADTKPNEDVKIDLEFLKPFAQKSVIDFTFKPDGTKTNVTWTMSGENNFMSKAFGLIMDMDKMIGPDFEKGLAQLKTVAEAAPKPEATVVTETK